MSDISALVKGYSASSLPPSVRTQRKDTTYEPGSGLSPDIESADALDFSAYRIMKNQFLLFISHPVYGIFLIAAQTTKTP